MKGKFKKQYSVAIDTVPLPEKPSDRVELVMRKISPVMDLIVRDAMSVAIGTWPTPEKPKSSDDHESIPDRREKIDKFKRELIDHRIEFQKQMERVRKQYPLVALAIEIERAVLIDVISNHNISELETIEMYEAIWDRKIISPETVVEGQRRHRKLRNCFGRSRKFVDGLPCIEEFNRGS